MALPSEFLDEVEAAARQLNDAHATSARTRLADALTTLSSHLLDHLDREEEALAPVLLTWKHWPNIGGCDVRSHREHDPSEGLSADQVADGLAGLAEREGAVDDRGQLSRFQMRPQCLHRRTLARAAGTGPAQVA